MQILNEFKQFLLRGNIVDMAVGLIMALAVFALVEALIADIITPVIAAIVGEPDFSALTFEINKSTFRYGDFINAVITFVSIAAALFFFVVVPMNALIAKSRRGPPADPTTKKCTECLSEIPAEARRCAFCTSEVAQT
jgi:large conductance mechanosensitive channel